LLSVAITANLFTTLCTSWLLGFSNQYFGLLVADKL
jgi:hypothetical protein